jgi:hypothetical protein
MRIGSAAIANRHAPVTTSLADPCPAQSTYQPIHILAHPHTTHRRTRHRAAHAKCAHRALCDLHHLLVMPVLVRLSECELAQHSL